MQNAQMSVGILIKKHFFLGIFHKDNLFSKNGFTSQKQTFRMVSVKGNTPLENAPWKLNTEKHKRKKVFGVMSTPLQKTVCEKLTLGKLPTKKIVVENQKKVFYKRKVEQKLCSKKC